MRLRSDVIGALNLFGDADATFTDDDVRVVQALADVATIAILQERALARAEALTEQLQSALTSRVLIEQAKGALAQADGITPEEAFTCCAPPRGRAAASSSTSLGACSTISTSGSAARATGRPRCGA